MPHIHGTTSGGLTTLLAALVLALSGCGGESPADLGEPDEQAPASSDQEGPYSRFPCDCIQDLFIDIGGRVPGFGGFWLEGSTPVVGVTDLALADTARAEARVFFHENRRERFGLRDEIRVVEVDYGFRQLAAWSDSVHNARRTEWKTLPCTAPNGRSGVCGFVSGLAADEYTNRVRIGVIEEEYISVVEAWADRKGIPREALTIDVFRLEFL